MSDDAQITDCYDPSNLQVLGVARSHALAVAYQSLAQSLGMLMLNAVTAQQSAAAINTAIVSLTVKRLLGSDTQTTENTDA